MKGTDNCPPSPHSYNPNNKFHNSQLFGLPSAGKIGWDFKEMSEISMCYNEINSYLPKV